MALISSSDLQYSYSITTTPNDDPRLRGEPDHSLFNRHEKYEVLYLINKLADKHNLKDKASGHKAERMIQRYLPTDIRKQEDVISWLEINWKKYD